MYGPEMSLSGECVGLRELSWWGREMGFEDVDCALGCGVGGGTGSGRL